MKKKSLALITILIIIFSNCESGNLQNQTKEVEVTVEEIENMINSGNLSDAHKILVILISGEDKNQEIYLLMAKCELLMGNVERSRIVVQQANELFGDSLITAFSRMSGLVYASLGDDVEAKRHYDQFLTIDSSSALAFNERGMIHMRIRNFNAAIHDFQHSLSIDYCATALNNLGRAFYNIGLFDDALDSYSKSIDLDSTMAVTYYNRGSLLVEATLLNEGLRDLKKAEKLGFNDEPTLFMNLGAAYFYSNDFVTACEYWHKAREKGNVECLQLIMEHCKVAN